MFHLQLPYMVGIESADTLPNISGYTGRYIVMIPVIPSTNAIYFLFVFAIDVFNGIPVCSTSNVVCPRVEIT